MSAGVGAAPGGAGVATEASSLAPMQSVSEREFRDTLARWASGVTVVTARNGGEPVGMTAASFSSLSLDPPLVLICIARSASSHDGLVGADGFAVHVLGAEQQEMSSLFARPGTDKFASFPDERGAFDAPLLPFGVARLVCERHSALDGGDHTILVGRVVSTELAGTDPLLYCNRAYGRLETS
jgi:flavin reductase (DIM6/NTAB) family NADH-FMN oxidoreductase RutF